MSTKRVSIVIPVYNEAENIPPLFDAIREHIGTENEILICYDFDEDNTPPAVDQHAGDFTNLRLIKNAYGRGPLGAIKSGFDAATGDAVLVMMADMSDDFTAFPRMLELLEEGCHVVAASRYMKGGRQIGGPLLKKTLSRLAGVSLHYLCGLKTHDATNSYRLYSKELLNRTTIESDGGFELGLELTVKAHLMGLRIDEVPATWLDRTAGASRFQMRKWLPKYLRWYRVAIFGTWFKPRHRPSN